MLNLRYVSALCAACLRCDCVCLCLCCCCCCCCCYKINVFGFRDQVELKLFIIHKYMWNDFLTFIFGFDGTSICVRKPIFCFQFFISVSLTLSLAEVQKYNLIITNSATNRSLHKRKENERKGKIPSLVCQRKCLQIPRVDEQIYMENEWRTYECWKREKWYDKTTDHFLCALPTNEQIWNVAPNLHSFSVFRTHENCMLNREKKTRTPKNRSSLVAHMCQRELARSVRQNI